MLRVRLAKDRGVAEHGWLSSRHTFSFADYHDPQHMGFRALRVINEDRVAPGKGFGTHSHRDMEIISYVLAGALEHKDSMGTGSTIVRGDVQRMSAGTGVAHSEYNASKTEPVHFLQIWLLPEARGMKPGYEQKSFSAADRAGVLRRVASPSGEGGSVTIHSDAILFAGTFGDGDVAEHLLSKTRHAFVHVALGRVRVNGVELEAGDAAAISNETSVRIQGVERAEVLLFDLG